MRAALVVAALALAGCASPTLPADPASMTPEQLKAAAADRNATVSCASVRGLTTTTTVLYLVLDRGVLPAGGVLVGADCSVAVQSAR